MGKSIGMAEYKTVSAGIFAADAMVKTAEVNVIEAATVCPGKYIIIIEGNLSAVNAAIDTAKNTKFEKLIDTFVLGNPDVSVLTALYKKADRELKGVLGVIETYNASAIIVAADTAAKTAHVNLIEIRMARGMCGKSYLTLTGDVASVTAAINAAQNVLKAKKFYLDSTIIARPDDKLYSLVVGSLNGAGTHI